MNKNLRNLAAFILSGSAGCADLMPNWCVPPGTADYQSQKAQYFDPYPLPDYGPDVEGARPREAIRPRSETAQVQNARSFYDRFRVAPGRQFGPGGPAAPPSGSTAAPLW